ncbi:hypothetical protein LEP1GSC103_1605 [Leptospira borgpetersenii serovar Javanica str. UI 09931]|uniref:Uncharacterized protein n=2 Tax=Leptospira borgpetersenii TaxID=174 RepID=A0ABN0HU27_LEPBO|nr:hypothetical protein LEP1GSC128_0264 [Leptospira borgpetersenii str. 200801926]EKQ90972.1 hypothetical protein LEP1GSC101_1188 [Leptospira borgpetersenii str. UI 09149]EMK09596.1 hypothetical protein LEP1GSC066_2462 [Leptospira sp. serovar Kenya str. Sh9]EMN13495.1 hypothetical protein LEP1GSC055_2970 [Leptospira borgpetersenii str. Brem 307]EMN56664.1 hypothetical protein LEP1GSC090_0260 [Leptospira borgpetersenii serovar Javanica str. MK146]ENO61792.1 hypothetical protein LEP1GSC191_1053 
MDSYKLDFLWELLCQFLRKLPKKVERIKRSILKKLKSDLRVGVIRVLGFREYGCLKGR